LIVWSRCSTRHSRAICPIRAHRLPATLEHYPAATTLDLSLCPHVNDATLTAVFEALPFAISTVNLAVLAFFFVRNAVLALSCCLDVFWPQIQFALHPEYQPLVTCLEFCRSLIASS
jgi:hypothetical protein